MGQTPVSFSSFVSFKVLKVVCVNRRVGLGRSRYSMAAAVIDVYRFRS